MDDFWTEIQDMPGEIFDITELEENESKMNMASEIKNSKSKNIYNEN